VDRTHGGTGEDEEERRWRRVLQQSNGITLAVAMAAAA
jgi:hypothetical protein